MALGRLVLDTNVLLSALHFHAVSLSWLRAAWREERLRPLVSRRTAAELIRVLAYPKFRLSEDDQKHLLDDYLPWCETVVVPDPPPDVPRCRDPSDRPFLELAVAGQADALVTGDGDLLVLAAEFSVPILAPAAAKDRLSGPGGEERRRRAGRLSHSRICTPHRRYGRTTPRRAAENGRSGYVRENERLDQGRGHRGTGGGMTGSRAAGRCGRQTGFLVRAAEAERCSR